LVRASRADGGSPGRVPGRGCPAGSRRSAGRQPGKRAPGALRLGLTLGQPPSLAGIAPPLEDPSDDLAAAAARLLAWLAPSRHAVDLLVAHLHRRPSPARQDALLAAAVALGAPRALDALHRRVAAGNATPAAIDALAVAGGPRKAALLAHLAAQDHPVAARAALACGHLGYAPAVLRLPSSLPSRDGAIALVFGDPPPDVREQRRLLRGRPWTVAAALEHASDPEECVYQRALRAGEIASRPGQGAPLPYDPESPAPVQTRAIQALAAATSPAEPAPGQWLFMPRTFL
jgi:hypothetical protein